MFFSIIIPVYNVERYLVECVDSILTQSFTSFEIILVDDGSTDGSSMICDAYAAIDPRIRVIHKKNGGQSSARNVGTREATGDYIIYIDSDDFIVDSDFLKKLEKISCKKDIIFFKHKKYNDTTKQFSKCTYSYFGIDENMPYLETLREMICRDAFFGMPWNKCIRRSLIEDNRIFFEEGLTGEDMDWNYYIILNGQSLAIVDEAFIAYRQRTNSVTTSLKIKNLCDYVMILEKWYQKTESGTYSTEEQQIMRASLAKYYSNLLIMYTRVKDREKRTYESRIYRLSPLLNFGLSRRPQFISKVYHVLGFKMTIIMLMVLDRIK